MRTLLGLAVVAVLVSSGYAIKCYVCNSHDNPLCKDLDSPTADTLLEECGDQAEGQEYTLCRKIEMALDMDFGVSHPAETRIQRACGWIDNTDTEQSCYYKSGYNTRSWVCACKEDGCNSASLPSVGAMVMLLPLAVLRVALY